MRGRPFRKGASGNPGGRPRVLGDIRELARRHTAIAVGTLVEVMKSAKSPPAARVAAACSILDRGYGRPGSALVQYKLPELNSTTDAAMAIAAITKGVTCGELTPSEGVELSRLVETYVTAFETTEIERRLQALEGQPVSEVKQ